MYTLRPLFVAILTERKIPFSTRLLNLRAAERSLNPSTGRSSHTFLYDTQKYSEPSCSLCSILPDEEKETIQSISAISVKSKPSLSAALWLMLRTAIFIMFLRL